MSESENDGECGRKMLAAAFEALGEEMSLDDWDELVVCERLIQAMAKAREVDKEFQERDVFCGTEEADAVASAYYAWVNGLSPEDSDPESVGGMQFSAFARAMGAIELMGRAIDLVRDNDGVPAWGFDAHHMVQWLKNNRRDPTDNPVSPSSG